MPIVLITGRMGSGKTELILLLKQRYYPVFIGDLEAKKFLKPQSPCYPELKKLFFESKFYLSDGHFNKKQLALSIFQDFTRRKSMQNIIHPLVRKSFKQFVEIEKNKGSEWVFYEIPLISSDFFKDFDLSILITCPFDVQKQRLQKKGWSLKEIQDRLAIQIPEKQAKDKADFIIDNSGDLKNLEPQLDKVLKSIL